MTEAQQANQEWSMGFVMDGLAAGRWIRALTVVDSYTRECLAIEVDSCLSSCRVARTLEWIIQQRGQPGALRCDNGPESTSRHFLAWCEEHKIQLIHIQPGRPMQNGRVESFNGRFRDECLNAHWFPEFRVCYWTETGVRSDESGQCRKNFKPCGSSARRRSISWRSDFPDSPENYCG